MVAVQNYHGNPAPPGKPVLTFQTGDVIELLRGDPESQWWEVGPGLQGGGPARPGRAGLGWAAGEASVAQGLLFPGMGCSTPQGEALLVSRLLPAWAASCAPSPSVTGALAGLAELLC